MGCKNTHGQGISLISLSRAGLVPWLTVCCSRQLEGCRMRTVEENISFSVQIFPGEKKEDVNVFEIVIHASKQPRSITLS